MFWHHNISNIKNAKELNSETMLEASVDSKEVKKSESDLNEKWTKLTWWNCIKQGISDEDLLAKLNGRVSKLEEGMEKYWRLSKVYNFLYIQTDPNEIMLKDALTKAFTEDSFTNLSFNVGQVAIDAHYNNIMKSTPKIKLQTKDSKSEVIREAARLEKYLNNANKKGGLNKIAPGVSKSGMISSVSHIKLQIDYETKSFKFFKVGTFDFLVENPYEGSSKRDEFFERKRIALWQLKELVEGIKDKKLIKSFKEQYGEESEDRFLTIFECYKTNGYKIIFTEKMIIYKSEWNFDFIPYAKYSWEERETGYIPIGLIEITQDCQDVINWILYVILQNAEFFQGTQLLIPSGSDISNQITNEAGVIMEYDASEGGRPFQLTPLIVNEQWFGFLDKVFIVGLKKARVSEAQQDGSIPTNVRSATGIQALNNLDSSRFVANKTRYQDMFVKLSKMMIKIGIKEFSKDYSFFKFAGKNQQEIYEDLGVYTGSLLEDSPQSKMNIANQLFSAEQISLEQYMTMLKIGPEEIPNVITARAKRKAAISKRIELALKKGKPLIFDEYLGVMEQEDAALRYYDDILSDSELSENDPRLIVIRKYLDEIKIKKQEQQKAQEHRLKIMMAEKEALKSSQKQITKI